MKKNKMQILLITILLIANSFAQTSTWKIDPVHSKIGFSISHLIISEVEGRFKNFKGEMVTDGNDIENAQISFTLKTKSIFTNNTKRDNHLKSKDFFNAEKYQNITFKSTSFEKTEGNKYKLTGDFQIKNITKKLVLDVVFGGKIKDPWGNTRAGFKITGKINRFDFGLKWNKLLEAGGAVVGKEVTLNCKVELIKQKD